MSLPPINLPPLSPGEPLTPETLPGAVRGWQVGQVLHATVVGQPTPRSANLRFGATTLPVQTRIPLTAGEPLKVRVDELGTTITLRLLTTPPATSPTYNDALRAALPRQQPFAPLLANIARLLTVRPGAAATSRPAPTSTPAPTSASTPTSTSAPTNDPPLPPLPPAIQKLVQQLFDALPEARRFATPEGVKRAIRDSGTFAETKLAASGKPDAPPPTEDTKLNLVKLLVALQPLLRNAPAATAPATGRTAPPAEQAAPPLRNQPPLPQPRAPATIVQLVRDEAPLTRIVQELASQLEGVLARVHVSQLTSLPHHAHTAQVWVAEVPVRHHQLTDVFQFRIEHRQPEGAQTEEYWSISFAFELEELGPMRARVVFFQQELNATLWAERESTARRFKERLADLRRRIEEHGLPVRNLDCLTGIPDADTTTAATSGLINEQA